MDEDTATGEDGGTDEELVDEPPVVIELNVLENAYDFVEESLRYAEVAASESPVGWKFAIVLAAQGIELLLKARLAEEHPLLLQVNPDSVNPGNKTVTVHSAIKRLQASGITLREDDIRRLLRAQRLRNEFLHYEVRATVEQLEAAYADLFEFAHVFHAEQFDDELHDHLSEDLYGTEAAVISWFRREMVQYQGSEVIRWFPSEIVDAQFALRLRVDDQLFERIRRGTQNDLLGAKDIACHDCSALKGQLHAWGCDSERCPACLGQLLTCDCDWEWEYMDQIDHWIPPLD